MSEQREKIYPPKGTFNFKDRHENAPDWILYRMGIHAQGMIDWLEGEAKNYLNDKGWLNLDVMRGKYGPNLQVNTYGLQPERKPPPSPTSYAPEPPPPSAAPEVRDFFAENGSKAPWDK